MPQDKSLLSEPFILRSLVDNHGLSLLWSTYEILSTCCMNTLMLDESHANVGLLDSAPSIKPSFPQHWAKLMVKLAALETLEVERNEKEGFNYPYLYPSHVPQAIQV